LEPKPASALPVDLIRTLAIVLVIFLHAAAFPYAIPENVTSNVMWNWWTVNIYDALGRVSVPLFVMLSGALLLDPAKVNEPLKVFFKKRLSRVGLPIVFWGAAFFAWQFLVNKEAFTVDNVINGVLLGPYYHFWFLYLLVGLYLVTPFLRVLVAYVDRKTFSYFMILWFVGTITLAAFSSFSSLNFNPSIFVFTGWIGYFLLGIYLQKVKVRSLLLIALVVLGFAVAVVGTYFVTADVGERVITFFHDSLSFNMIAASAALFLLLCKIKPERIAKSHLKVQRLLHWISQNTLPIYLFHVMVLETLEKGYLGITLNMTTVNPLIEIPLITLLTLALCMVILYPLGKIRYVKKIIG
jgi:surface polysaccharide O-acyltransferase-like enzyme